MSHWLKALTTYNTLPSLSDLLRGMELRDVERVSLPRRAPAYVVGRIFGAVVRALVGPRSTYL